MSNYPSKKDLLAMYELMYRVRALETHQNEWYYKGIVKEADHSCLGAEAINVGCCYGLQKQDKVMPSLRSRGAFLCRGVDFKTTFMTQMVKAGNWTNGHETSHHSAYPELGVLGGTGMVGSSLSISVGAALAEKYRGTDGVVYTFVGDGGSSRGDAHESMVFAVAKQLPIVFVIENNQIAMTTQQNEFLPEGFDLGNRAKGYGMPGYTVDGNDVVEVYMTAMKCTERARTGGGPSLINAVTIRMSQHMEAPYGVNDIRPDLLEKGKTMDPLERVRKMMIGKGDCTQADFDKIESNVEAEIMKVFEEIKDLPQVDEASMLTNVYHE